jgi:hypothetical protein
MIFFGAGLVISLKTKVKTITKESKVALDRINKNRKEKKKDRKFIFSVSSSVQLLQLPQ